MCWCTTLCNSLEVDCTKEVSSGEGQSLCLRAQLLGLMPDISKKNFWLCCFHPLTFFMQFCSQSLSLSSKQQSDQVLHIVKRSWKKNSKSLMFAELVRSCLSSPDLNYSISAASSFSCGLGHGQCHLGRPILWISYQPYNDIWLCLELRRFEESS